MWQNSRTHLFWELRFTHTTTHYDTLIPFQPCPWELMTAMDCVFLGRWLTTDGSQPNFCFVQYFFNWSMGEKVVHSLGEGEKRFILSTHVFLFLFFFFTLSWGFNFSSPYQLYREMCHLCHNDSERHSLLFSICTFFLM